MSSTFIIDYKFRYDPNSKKKKDNNIENFYSHHRMKIYDSSSVESIWNGEEKKVFSFNISDELFSKYANVPEVTRYLNRMRKFQSIYSVTIQPNRSFRFRTDSVAKYYNDRYKEYEQSFSLEFCRILAKTDVENEYFSKEGREKHAGEDLKPKYNYFVTIFSAGLSLLMQQIFVSTMAYEQSKVAWPSNVPKEGFSLKFDTGNMTATLIDMEVYNPDNPYNKYIRNHMRITRSQNLQSQNDKEAINFYVEDRITPWMPYDEKEFSDKMKSEDNTAGIYMLYDSHNNYFYVGKSNQVFKRMKEHRDSNELIRQFDYYRYSLIDPNYYDDIFLIENAAIHDIAMILKMTANTDYNEKSLAAFLPRDVTINSISMVNNHKKQTKRPGIRKK